MNKTTLLLLAIGAAVLFGAKKLFGGAAAAPKSLAEQGRGALGALGNSALAAIPPQYGFKAPAAAPLGGNRTVTANGASVDIGKFLKGIGDLFKTAPGTNPYSKKGEDWDEGDYARVADRAAAHEREQARAALVSAGLPETPYQTAGPGGEVYTDLGGFYSAVPLDPQGGYPGRNFSLEDGPLNTTEGPAEITNPFLYDAPGGADFSYFAEPESQFA